MSGVASENKRVLKTLRKDLRTRANGSNTSPKKEESENLAEESGKN